MEIVKSLIGPAQPLIVAFISLVFAWLANEIRANVHSARAQGILLRLTDLAETVTGELQQTVVDVVKASAPNSKLEPAVAIEIKRQAIEKIQAHLGPKGVKEVLKVFGYKDMDELQSLIASKVEASLAQSKQFAPLASIATLETTTGK